MFIENLKKYRIILASRSPRRQELLKDLGVVFDIVIKDYNESYPSNLKSEEIALYLAKSKAEQFRSSIYDNEIVITADTIVWCDDMVLDKPVNRDDAIRILKVISGKTHEVITGMCLLSSKKEKVFFSKTKVTFDNLTDSEITYYIDNFKPYDKAGAYGIQEWIGYIGITHIEGSYFNVMGLPIQRLYKELQIFITD